jgi:superfamily II DNA/RNA helicase
VEGVKVVNDIQSKTKTWYDLNIPQWLIDKLVNPPVLFRKPAIIQAKAIPAIMEKGEIRHNFIFQSFNGSGKTGAFVIPAIMTIDPDINAYQIVISCHTRELHR